MATLDRNAFVKLDDGVIVERDVLNIVEKIREYDENLCVQYLDPSSGADFSDAPYRIVEVCPDGMNREVFSVWTLDETVLERIYAADNNKQDILLQLDRNNQAARANQKRRYEDKTLETRDIIESVLKSPKGTYKFKSPTTGETVTIDDSLTKLPPEGSNGSG